MASLKVKAVYEYTSEEPDDLSFPVGQIINITEEIDADWYEGEYTDASGVKRTGIFPNNFVEKYEPEVPLRPSRPSRPKQDTQPATAAPREPEPVPEPEPLQQEAPQEEDPAPPVPAISKPQPPPVTIPAEVPQPTDEVRSPPVAISERSPVAQAEPPAAPKPAPAEPVSAESRKPPPPVAPKSNAFKDRIAAFNQPAAAPVMPFQPQGHKSQPSNFIKKPFVAPPPSSHAYVPPVIKQEPQHIPYRREEDPEIKQRQEEDRAAAEAAGLGGESQQGRQEDDDEDAPKPQSLKERIALLQKQQAEQAQRRAGGGEKKEKKTPARKASEPAPEGDNDELERVRSPGDERQSLDVSRDRPRVPSVPSHAQEPMSPLPDAPQHEILSGGEEADQSAAGETTEDDAGTIGPDDSDAKPVPPRRASTAPKEEADVGDEQDTTEDAEEEEEEEDSMDEETRKREELRQRMAKMSGGMGMAGMFGPPGGMPMPGKSAPKKRSSTKDSNRQASGDAQSPTSPAVEQQRVPMMPIPGMARVQSPQSEEPRRSVEKEREPETHPISSERQPDVVPDVEDVKPEPLPRASLTEERGAAPPVPKERPLSQAAPPVPEDRPVPRPPPGPPAPESRPVPPPPPSAAPAAMPLSPGPGSESDDEASVRHLSAQTPTAEAPLPIRNAPPPVPIQREAPPQPKRASYFGTDESAPHTAPSERRSSRVPPIPSGSPLVSPRPPPPPPPQVPAPQPTISAPQDDERGESDYEGDYDTDIASSAKHKDALKSHTREVSYDGSTTADDTPVTSPVFSAPPPPIHRAVPPPPPQAAPRSRPSMDAPRAPPPAPPQRDMSYDSYGGDYDPYRYNESSKSPPPVPGAVPISAPPIPPREAEVAKDESSDDMYSASPPRKSMDRPPPPPPTQPEQQAPMPPMPPVSQPTPPSRAPPRQSLDVQRTPVSGRRSMDQGRPASDNGQIAGDINLSQETPWWTADQPLPPVLQSRKGVDILSESEESKTTKRGGRTEISKDIYILYIDYSQTIITARYDSQEPANVSLEQRHEPPPAKLRQDQLETYWQRYGARIADTAASLGNSKKDSTVGDGTPFALISDLIKAQPEALHPVGTRAFGALVYANLANASVMQFDEIRAGDIVTLRNAKFEGKHSGPMHQKYKQDLGAGHVAIVAEWDGTRKKVRAWEQGREKAKVRMESFRLGDLKSGEVRVWRVVGREWVGWEGEA